MRVCVFASYQLTPSVLASPTFSWFSSSSSAGCARLFALNVNDFGYALPGAKAGAGVGVSALGIVAFAVLICQQQQQRQQQQAEQ